MQFKTLLLAFTLGFVSLTAIAGGGHDHGHSHSPVDKITAKAKATKIIANLVNQKTIAKSWGSASADSVEKKTFKSKQEWVVSFVNKEITDTDKRKLYIFLTLTGDYIAANYTGK